MSAADAPLHEHDAGAWYCPDVGAPFGPDEKDDDADACPWCGGPIETADDEGDEFGPDRPDRQFASRITIDLDADKYDRDGFDLRATRTWHNLQNDADYVDVHVSSSGLGLHFVAWYEQPLRFHEEVAARRTHGDDPRRTWMDCQRWLNGLYTDVLFEEKDSRPMEKERRFSTVYDALDYIREHRRNDTKRMKALAEHGHRAAPELARRARRDA